MISADFMRIENSVKGSCATSANTIERVKISCLKLDGNEDSLCATLKDMGFHKLHIQVSGLSLIVTAERIIPKASDEATESRETNEHPHLRRIR